MKIVSMVNELRRTAAPAVVEVSVLDGAAVVEACVLDGAAVVEACVLDGEAVVEACVLEDASGTHSSSGMLSL